MQLNSSLPSDGDAQRPRADAVTPRERELIARLAAYTSWANTTDRTARTAKARAAARDRFLTIVDPDGVLPEHVRRQRADAAYKAHMTSLSLKAAKARRAKKAS